MEPIDELGGEQELDERAGRLEPGQDQDVAGKTRDARELDLDLAAGKGE